MLTENRIEETRFSLSDQVPTPPERRQQERIVTILRVGVLVVAGRRELCLMRNVSTAGMLAHVYSPVEPGQQVIVELKTNQNIPATIAWVKDENAGIAFDTPVDIAALLANPQTLDNGWRPRMPRVEVDRLATLRIGAETHWVHIRDISQGGVKIELETPVEVGTEVVLTPEHSGPIAGAVRWHNGHQCGIAFNALMPFDQLVTWLRRAA